MNSVLRDLCVHQLWADAEHWRAIEGHPPAAPGLAITKPDQFGSLAELKAYARGSHDEIDGLLGTLTDARLDSVIVMPWFSDPPLSITVAEALTQCAMHSHYHRGQNATRLRELGGEPPTTDLIVWQWKGRPAGV